MADCKHPKFTLTGPWFHTEGKMRDGTQWAGQQSYYMLTCSECDAELSAQYLRRLPDYSGRVWSTKHGTFVVPQERNSA